MQSRAKTILVAALTVTAIGSAAAPAFAEGSFESYMTNWYADHESRSWFDGNLDATNGHATYTSCVNNAQSSFTVKAYHEDFGPDTQVGSEAMQCTTSADAMYWGDVQNGNYHWTLKVGSNISAHVMTYY